MRRYPYLFSSKVRMAILILVVVLLLAVAVSLAVPLVQTSRKRGYKTVSIPSSPSPVQSGSPLKLPEQPLLTPTANVMPTATPAPPQARAGAFTTLPPGAQLPSEAECAAHVRRSSWEPRPGNSVANHTVPTAQQIAGLVLWEPDNGQDAKVNALGRQITGNFTGTTDEILQWVACKWGINVNIVRAQAVVESHWHQNDRGDQTNDARLCPPGTWNGTSCYQSYGLLQIKYVDNKTVWPMS